MGGISAAGGIVAGVAAIHDRYMMFNMANINKMLNTNNPMSFEEAQSNLLKFDDLEKFNSQTNVKNVEKAIVKYGSVMTRTVEAIKKNAANEDQLSKQLSRVNDMMTKAWKVPSYGYEMGNAFCDIMGSNGGLDVLMDRLDGTKHESLRFNSAKLLKHCLVTENRGYVIEKGLDKVVHLAKQYTGNINNPAESRVGTGILEHLFKHDEATCGDVIAMGGLDTVVNECKSTDVETLRHCASALANVAMYGGSENQEGHD